MHDKDETILLELVLTPEQLAAVDAAVASMQRYLEAAGEIELRSKWDRRMQLEAWLLLRVDECARNRPDTPTV